MKEGEKTVRNGFSLVELMIVLTIVGILAAIATPSYQTFMAHRRLNGAARQIMSHLMLARQRAVTQNHQCKVFFDAGTHSYTILNDSDNDGTADTGERTEVKDIRQNYDDISFSTTADPIFYPQGTAASGMTVTITSAGIGYSKYVKVAATGRVKIDDTP